VKWWTTDPTDKRSKVTLRQLLTFTSGFGDGHPGDEHLNARRLHKIRGGPRLESDDFDTTPNPSDCVYNYTDTIDNCAQTIYNNVKMIGEPGEVWSYNSNHLQLAGAMAAAASNLTI
jgi:CubicO group peptidase (beta-lactamase class C family)